ncbi:hypothetical protein [Streptomyces sp. NPDC021020]|uniref:hypothetical protein n=1 Tax=Streptomyces sp. NPDC021020 TaxID=3365109 RepID=UPI00378EB26D
MPYDANPPPTITAQATALQSLSHFADAHPDLPGAYVVSHSAFPKQVDVLLDGPADLETWRDALDIATNALTLKHYDARRHLEFTTPIGTTLLRVYTVFPDTSTTPEGSQP